MNHWPSGRIEPAGETYAKRAPLPAAVLIGISRFSCEKRSSVSATSGFIAQLLAIDRRPCSTFVALRNIDGKLIRVLPVHGQHPAAEELVPRLDAGVPAALPTGFERLARSGMKPTGRKRWTKSACSNEASVGARASYDSICCAARRYDVVSTCLTAALVGDPGVSRSATRRRVDRRSDRAAGDAADREQVIGELGRLILNGGQHRSRPVGGADAAALCRDEEDRDARLLRILRRQRAYQSWNSCRDVCRAAARLERAHGVVVVEETEDEREDEEGQHQRHAIAVGNICEAASRPHQRAAENIRRTGEGK